MAVLELRENNLYINGEVIDFGDEQLLIREPLVIVGNELDRYHVVTEYDRIDLIAFRYYKSVSIDPSKWWWVIADANNIIDPFDLSEYVGKNLLIPDLNRIKLVL